ncbi:hypothetical protein PIB30_007627 [Stylosanthes scabra]|uniref:Uncharacterized protein n=1 Tax=Stylosanthes scabra TaxID=79078 RepID=A0ABU6V2Z8_9FABA|nr:hypothetical protein [Stylosanthes scabra]
MVEVGRGVEGLKGKARESVSKCWLLRRSSAASEASSFASNRAYCGYSPSRRYVRNTTASSGSSFASTRRFTPNPTVDRTSPPSTISEMGSSYRSADSEWSFASNRAVCNYNPVASTTSARNSNRRLSGYDPPVNSAMNSSARHSASSYNSSLVSGSSSFASNRSVRGYAPAPPLSSTMNSSFIASSNGFLHGTTQLSNSSDVTGSRHTTTYGNFIRSSQSLENNPTNNSSHHHVRVSCPIGCRD